MRGGFLIDDENAKPRRNVALKIEELIWDLDEKVLVDELLEIVDIGRHFCSANFCFF